MHYDTSYKNLPDSQKKQKALLDIIDYLGKERFDQTTEKLKAFDPNRELFAFAVSFVGVQGYPVEVWFDYVYGVE